MERDQDDPLKDQHFFFSDGESGRSATFFTRCYGLVFKKGPSLASLCSHGGCLLNRTVLCFPLFGISFCWVSFRWVFDYSFQGTGIPLAWPRTQVSAASFSTDLDDKGTHECFNDLYYANVSFT